MKKALTNRIIISITAVFVASLAVVFSSSIQVSATGRGFFVKTEIDQNISVTPNSLPFGKVYPEEVLYKPVTIALSQSCKTNNTFESIEYTIVQKARAKKQSDKVYCENNPNDRVKCYPSLCPYLSKETDNNPANDSGVPAFHDPQASSSIAKGILIQKTDIEDKWTIDLHVPCFKGECAQDYVVPKDYELDPSLNGKQFACDLNIIIGTTTKAFKEKEGTIGFWKNWNSQRTYTQGQINGWLTTINASSTWLLSEQGYSVNTSGMTSLISDSTSCNGAQRSCQKKKFLAQYLVARLNFESGRKALSNSYTFNSFVNAYWGTINPVTLAVSFAKAESKAPDNGTTPLITQFNQMAQAFDVINNTGI